MKDRLPSQPASIESEPRSLPPSHVRELRQICQISAPTSSQVADPHNHVSTGMRLPRFCTQPGAFLDPTLLLNLKRQTFLPHLHETDCGSAYGKDYAYKKDILCARSSNVRKTWSM